LRIRTRSILIALSRGLTQVSHIGVAVVLVRLLTKEQFGSYRQVMLVALFLSGLLGTQLPLSLYYFVPKLGSERRRALLTQTLLLAVVAGGAAVAVMFFGSGPIARQFDNPSLASLLSVFCLFPAVQILLAIIPDFMISAERAGRGCVYILLREGVRAGAVVTAAVLGVAMSSLLLALLIGMGALAAVGVADMFRLSPGRRTRLDFDLVRQQLVYLLPMAAASVVGLTNKFFGQFLISSFFETEEFAVYAAGAVRVPVYMVVTSSVFAAVMPNLVKLWDEGAKDQMLRLWREAVRKCALLTFPVFVALMVCAQDLILLMYGEAYRQAAWPFMVYLVMLPIQVAVYGSFLRAVGRTRPIAVSATIALITNVVFSLTILLAARQWLGEKALLAFLAPAIGTVLAIACSSLYTIRQAAKAAQRRFVEIMPWGDLARLLGLAGAAGVGVYFVPLQALPLAARVVVRAASCILLFILLALATRSFRPDELRMLTWPLRRVRRLKGSRGVPRE
jgi:O-antigen/teichoic acid export membrane protein